MDKLRLPPVGSTLSELEDVVAPQRNIEAAGGLASGDLVRVLPSAMPASPRRRRSDRSPRSIHVPLDDTTTKPSDQARRDVRDAVVERRPRRRQICAKAADLRAICRRVIVGPPASAAIRSGAGRPPPDLLALFEAGFSGGLGLGFRYQDRAGNRTSRRAEPHGLLVQTPVWYVLGRDADKGEPRMFRMDRISSPRLLDDVRFRPSAEVIWAQLPPEVDWRPLSRR